MEKKTAIILGATGLTGGLLLKDDSFKTVKLFSRRSVGIAHVKIQEYLVDLLVLENQKEHFKADVVFCCIGTTQKKTPDKNLYQAIDVGIPTAAAQLCSLNGIETFVVMSSMGANSNSPFFYNRLKGNMETQVLNQNIKNTYILRPSLIIGDRKESRLGEGVATIFMRLFNPLMIGSLQKYRSIKASTIAKCMHRCAIDRPKDPIISSLEIKQIAQGS